MDLITLLKIRNELLNELIGRQMGKVFPLSRFEIVIDFRGGDSRYLFVSVEPADPRIYLIRRRLKELERASVNPSPFVMQMKKMLSGAMLGAIEMIENERVLKFAFAGDDEFGSTRSNTLAAQLTGRSANLFLLDGDGIVTDSIRRPKGVGQETGTIYSVSPRPEGSATQASQPVISSGGFESLSAALDAASIEKYSGREFKSTANSARGKIKQEIGKRVKLRSKLNADIAGHGDAERWKRCGDLLLANISTAKRVGSNITVTDFYDENLPEIEIDIDENDSVSEAAEKFFRRYAKARNAGEEVSKRLTILSKELERLEANRIEIERAIDEKDEEYLAAYISGPKREPTEKVKKNEASTTSTARSFISSDGFEILVGKKAKDNDYLTFRIAKSLDTWMHAADYPGSHVVIRNPNRKEIPSRTMLEAAQLAAFYSQGKSQTKAAVHYTQKKFVNRPKGAAPGLVSLASFKTLLVEPKVPIMSEPPAAAKK